MSSIVHIYRRYPTPASCIKKLEAVRWGDKPLCPYCGSESHAALTKTMREDRPCADEAQRKRQSSARSSAANRGDWRVYYA
jgi:hypothetical protein